VNTAASTNLPLVPKTGTSKALVVFVQFTDDNFEGGCSTDPNIGWPVTQPHSLPPWWTKAIDPTATGAHTPGSITDYFCKMSRKKNDPGGHGDFHLIGEVYPQLVEPGTSPGALTRQNQATKANEVLRTVRDNAASLGNRPQCI